MDPKRFSPVTGSDPDAAHPRQITWSALLLRMPFRLFFSPFAHFRRRRENYALLL